VNIKCPQRNFMASWLRYRITGGEVRCANDHQRCDTNGECKK
jgi:hypothetical protein